MKGYYMLFLNIEFNKIKRKLFCMKEIMILLNKMEKINEVLEVIEYNFEVWEFCILLKEIVLMFVFVYEFIDCEKLCIFFGCIILLFFVREIKVLLLKYLESKVWELLDELKFFVII